MKAENLTDCVNKLLEMSGFSETLTLLLRWNSATWQAACSTFVAYREYLARTNDGETGGASHYQINRETENAKPS